MARLFALDEPFVQKDVSVAEAREMLAGQKYKLERLADVEASGEAISTYTVGDCAEMCRGRMHYFTRCTCKAELR